MIILGISAFYHDAAACILRDGVIVAAAQEERFSRKKHDSNFPLSAILFCIKEAGVKAFEIDFVVFYEKPIPKFERLIETYFAFAPRGFRSFSKAMPIWLTDKLFQKKLLIKLLSEKIDASVDWKSKIRFSEHHLSHAASAFFPSPFKSAAVLTMDGVGEWPTTSISLGQDENIQILKEIHFPHSLGLLYSAFTYFTGFKVNSGEYKLMGLAPYGEPRFAQTILDNLIDIKNDGSFRLNMDYFAFATELKMTNERFASLFGGPARESETQVTQREMDIAASIQRVTELVVIKLAEHALEITGEKNLCLAGGVALNCVANGKILKSSLFERIWIQPAAGDAGGALGAALAAHHMMLENKRIVNPGKDSMSGSYLGTSYSQTEIDESLKLHGANFKSLTDEEVIEIGSTLLAKGYAIGWFQGRMEYGPRALGNRSILADPRDPATQRTLNLKVKFRESFRPFAPSVLRECLEDWFELKCDSPYMLMVSDVKKSRQISFTEEQQKLKGIEKLNISRSDIPAVTHLDYSARIQTVHADTNERFHSLIKSFQEKTGCPVVVNTSFNIRGEPIVESPLDAFRCFMGTNLDALFIGNSFLLKSDQSINLKVNYQDLHELD